MATYGWEDPNWEANWEFFGFNFQNNVSTGNLAMPYPGGTVTAISFNCGLLSGSGGPMVANGCLWSTSGGLLVAGSQVTLPTVGQQKGPYAWSTSTCSFAVASGAGFRMGWWRDPHSAAGDNILGFGPGGTTLFGTTANSSAPGSFSQVSSASQQIGIYITYTPNTPTPTPVPPPVPTPAANPFYQRQIYELMREGLLPK